MGNSGHDVWPYPLVLSMRNRSSYKEKSQPFLGLAFFDAGICFADAAEAPD